MASPLNLGDLVYRLGFENEEAFLGRLDEVMRRGTGAASEGGKRAGRGWTDQFKAVFGGAALGSFVGDIFSQAFNQASAAIQQFFVDSVQAARGFEASLSNIATLGANSAEQMAGLRQGLIELGPAIGEGPQALSAALYDVVSAGFSGQEALDVLEASAKAARAGLTDTKTAADAVTTALNAYNLPAQQATRITDALQTTVALGKTTWDELGSSIGQVIPIAASGGVGIEELGAAIAALTAQGIATPQAMTGMRQALIAIINPSAQARTLANQLGIEFNGAALRAQGFEGVLRTVARATGGNQEQMARLFGSVEALNSVLALTSDSGAARFTRAQEMMRDAAGATERAYAQQMTTAAGAQARFAAAMEAVQIAVGEQLTPSIAQAQNLFADFALGFMRQSGQVAITANQDMLSAGVAMRGFAETVWTALNSAAAAFSQFVVWFGYHADGVEIRAETTAERLGATFGGIVHSVTSAIATASETIFRWFGALPEIERGGGGGGGGGRATIGPAIPIPDAPSPDAAAAEARAQAEAAAATARAEAAAATAAREGGAPPPTPPRVDPLIDEARRIQTHFDLLRLSRESDRINARDYEAHIEAHLRRLGGMYERAGTAEQRSAVLRTESALRRELERLASEAEGAEKARLGRILAAQREYQDSRLATTRQQLAAELEMEQAAARRRAAASSAAHQQYADLRMAEELAAQAEAEQTEQAAARRRDRARIAAYQQYADLRMAEERAAQAEREQMEQRQQEHHLALLREQFEARQVAANNERQLRDNEYQHMLDTGQVTREQHLENLRLLLLGYQEFSDEWLRITSDIRRLEEAIERERLEAARAAQDERNALLRAEFDQRQAHIEQQRQLDENRYQYELEAGIITREQHLENLRLLLLGYGEFSTEWMAITRSIRQLEQEITQEDYAAERARVQAIIQAEGELTEAVRLELIRRLEAELVALDASVRANQVRATAIQEGLTFLRGERGADVEGLEQQLTAIALSFPRALVQGIKEGDIGGALREALGGAANFFVERMIQGILGPIAEQLAASVARSMTGTAVAGAAGTAAAGAAAINPVTIALGMGALFLSLILGAQRRPAPPTAQEAVRAGGAAPAITYNLNASVTVNARLDFDDPAFHQRWRGETEALVVSLLRRVREGQT